MTAYYNEFDPKAAAGLCALIADGLIPAGEVDTRSITDVRPDDLKGFIQCHLFAGIGGWPLALRMAGWSDGQMTDLFGQVLAPANHTAHQENIKVGLTVEISGLSGSVLCRDASKLTLKFQLSLESKLRTQFPTDGSIECLLTWDAQATPAGRRFCRLLASARPTLETGSGMWPTPLVQNGGRQPRGGMSMTGQTPDGKKRQVDVRYMATEAFMTPPQSLVDSQRARPQGQLWHDSEEKRRQGQARSIGTPGFWDDYEQIICADGKARRIPTAQSGIRLLAHGIPERVGLISTAGNAIVPEVASRFIKASREAIEK